MKMKLSLAPTYVRAPEWFVFCLLLFAFPVQAEEEYVFERMWPTFQQPWYFFAPTDVEIDSNGFVYIVDDFNTRIVKLNSDGRLITSWGKGGYGNGEFIHPRALAIDPLENFILVIDDDERSSFIQKFSMEGVFLDKFGGFGSGNGEFKEPEGITFDQDGNIYVADCGNNRVQKLSNEGKYISQFPINGVKGGDGFLLQVGIEVKANGEILISSYENNCIYRFDKSGRLIQEIHQYINGPSDLELDGFGNLFILNSHSNDIAIFDPEFKPVKQFYCADNFDYHQSGYPLGLAISQSGVVYVAESYFGSIKKYSLDGMLVDTWSTSGKGNGFFLSLAGIAIDENGFVYATDPISDLINKFDADGNFKKNWGHPNSLCGPHAITTDKDNNLYVADCLNYGRVQKFNSDGAFISEWNGDGGLYAQPPRGIIVDRHQNIFVADSEHNKIIKYDSLGFVQEIGSSGNAPGQFARPHSLALTLNGNIVVSDNQNHRMQVFSPTGEFINSWGELGSGNGQFYSPKGVAVGPKGNIYVADSNQDRIQVFDTNGNFITKFGEYGFGLGQFNHPYYIAVNTNGKVYVTDRNNNRIQVFRKIDIAKRMAIILAGGETTVNNPLWPATQMNANFAYRALTHQGFTKNSIYYLTADTDLDLDNNGELDDVDGDATKANLQYAVTQWAADADEVVLYLVDHGGDKVFRLNETEVMTAVELDAWLDQLQSAMPGKVTVVYDACQSGSFLSELAPPPGRERVTIASAGADEEAYFAAQGSVSFSNYFWTHVFNGLPVGEAFDLSRQALAHPDAFQTPLLDADGDGIGNEPEDLSAVAGAYIGNGTEIRGDMPVIGTVSPDQTISGTNQATLSALDVTDDDGIARVWAVIRPPGFKGALDGQTVQSLPSADLMPGGGNAYEAVFDRFDVPGTYRIVVYARDRIGNTALPKLTTVAVNSPRPRRALVVAGGAQADATWPAVEKNCRLTHEALRFQGYPDDAIYFLSPVTFSAGVDGTNVRSNVRFALETWAADARDLVVYFVGGGGNGAFALNPSETLFAAEVKTWLDALQAEIPGPVAAVFDFPGSGGFAQNLAPPSGKERILIAGSGVGQTACFASGGDLSFSHYFWRQTANGASVRDAFRHAANALLASRVPQTPTLDDDGDGIGNEVGQDGRLARETAIGSGIMLAGDPPLIGGVSPEQNLNGEAAAALYAENVTTTGTIDQVWATIAPPDFVFDPAAPEARLPVLALSETAPGRYEGTWGNFAAAGTYEIAFFARDADGDVSMPVSTRVIQQAAAVIPDETGDVNGDGFQTLMDAMIALKVLAGDAEAGLQVRWDYEASDADVSGNGRVELEEAVFGLQMAAEVR